MKKILVEQILHDTESGYNLIAEKFSETRRHFWRDLAFVGDFVRNGDKVLDFGCGNGRLLKLIGNMNIIYHGVDVSEKLIDIARKKYPDRNFQKISSSQKLPYPDDNFNIAYSIAVFHHIPSKELRNETAKELYRVTKPGGSAIISVWNLWRAKYIKYIFLNWLRKIIRRSELDWNDCYLPFKNDKGEVFQRYHHAFTKEELRKTFLQAGFFVKDCGIIKKNNIVLVAVKQ